jgi:molybdopterin/thiamine biosynthesis adenylyltransferase
MPINSQERYSRHTLFAPIGEVGQQRLLATKVALVGCGATGTVLASLLARAGVGMLRIIDRDYVEASNLQRQILFDEQDAAESLPKAIAATRKLAGINSDVALEPCAADLTPANAGELLGSVDLILDGTDNFETRYLINDFSVSRRVPWIYCAAVASYGATLNIVPHETACLRCIFAEPPRDGLETCDTAGIVNSVAATIAAMAATEAVKMAVGAREALRKTLLSIDLWKNARSEVAVGPPREDCPACARGEFPYLGGAEQPQITLCGRNSVQIHERRRPVDFAEMAQRLRPHGDVRHNQFVLKFWRQPYEMTLFPDGRAIIKGTADPAAARSLYARYIGS